MLRALILALALSTTPVLAQEQPATSLPSAVNLPTAIVTRHHGVFNGKRVAYEPIEVSGLDGKPTARLLRSPMSRAMRNPADRSCSCSMAGPSSARTFCTWGLSVRSGWPVPDDISAPVESFRMVDNPYTILDVADLVFFDPAGTGLSRLQPGVDIASQYSTVADSRQLASLVVEWTKIHGRSASPIYLAGESYGTLRAPKAAHQLQQAGVLVNGILLLGQAVNIIEYSQRRGNIVSYAVSLPTLAATAWAHGKADTKGRSFDQFLADAQAFASQDYIAVLFQGDTAPPDRQRAAAARLQEFTGLPADWYLAHQLRITKVDYQKTLLPGQRLGTNDARYAGPADGPDPFDKVPARFMELFKAYLTKDLGAGGVGEYAPTGPFIGGAMGGWDWGPNKSPFGDWPFGRAITDIMEANPRFRLLVGNGWTDTQTTVGAMDHLVSQSGWPRDRVRTVRYQGGHMPYTIESSLKALTDDMRALVTRKW